MNVFQGMETLPTPAPLTALAIGTFDGVHRGHQALLRLAVERARSLGGEAWVLTFDPHPSLTLGPDLAPPLLCTTRRRLELIKDEGLDAVLLLPFDKDLADTTCEAFVEHFVLRCGAREVVVGYDYTFGRGRAGNAETLKELGSSIGVTVHVVPPVTIDGGIVPSSTRIRQLLLEGRVEAAEKLLGRPHEVSGLVVPGEGRGTTIGFPTANIEVEGQVLLPANGVYAVQVAIEEGGEGVGMLPGAANIGTNPTFRSSSRVLFEIHIMDYEGPSLVGRRLTARMVKRLRSEERFDSVDLLVAQIERDVQAARQALHGRTAPVE